jgi:prepilin-type N-terminal cleavage/methylation domain-containing protein
MYARKNISGFTLLEIMVAVSLFVVVVLVTGSMYVLAQKSYKRSSDQNELIQNARVCLDRLSRELRQANDLINDITVATSTIFFQDGHNLDEINYIRYYLQGADFKRASVYYYFSSDPNTKVYYNSIDAFGNPPIASTTEDRIVCEYLDNLELIGTEGLVNISMDFIKGNNQFPIDTKIFIRDW